MPVKTLRCVKVIVDIGSILNVSSTGWRKMNLFDELEKYMRKNYNSNFRIDTLDIVTKLALLSLCKILDKKLSELRNDLTKENKMEKPR
jgi:hypothetical protein